jgi:predicted MFS family arabinose efflux permease
MKTAVGPSLTGEEREEASAVARQTQWVYLVAVLTVAYALNFVDRQIVNILAEPIKKDLGLLDWQLGALTGLAFALVYAVMALPIARLADRANRPRLIASALTVWSLGTMACSAASGFGQLAVARLGVGLGESGFTPTAHSLLAESVPKGRRNLAFGIFYTGFSIGSMMALAVGGVIADLWGWRPAFLLAGVPGIIVALTVYLTVRDPVRSSGTGPRSGNANFRSDAASLLKKKSFRLFVLGGGLFGMSSYGISAFIFSFISRTHGSEIDDFAHGVNHFLGISLHGTGVIGPILGCIAGVTGISSALFSGWLTDRLVARDVKYFSVVTAIPQVLAVPVLAIAFTTAHLMPSLAAYASGCALMGLVSAPLSACIQFLADASNRATASAISMLVLIGFGNGLGPFLVGVLSDIAAHEGFSSGAALRIALLTIAIVPMCFAVCVLLLAARYLPSQQA